MSRTRRFRPMRFALKQPQLEWLELRQLLSTVLVTSTSDSDSGSLRAAILAANDPASGIDTIDFAIPGTGVHIISPLSALPTINRPVTIDGYSQPGSSPNSNGPGLGDDAVIDIEIRGNSAGGGVSGLVLSGGQSTVTGVAINDFQSNAIALVGNGGDVIAGNFIGTDATGDVGLPDDTGVLISAVGNNTIGGLSAGARNVISTNGYDVRITGGPAATANLVAGNLIGTNAAGNHATTGHSGGSSGVWIDGSPGNTIGGNTPAARNVITLKTIGIDISGTAATANRIIGNYVGTDVTGMASLANILGVVDELSASGNTIGGTEPGDGNLLSGNVNSGIELNNEHSATSGTTGNLIEGNLIGTDATGAAPLGSGANQSESGVLADEGASGNTIGGTVAGAGNVIAFNAGQGVWILDSDETGDAILGNSIYSNTKLGIALSSNLTFNTPGGPHVGPDHLQNYPVITSATTASGNVRIQGTFNSNPLALFRLEFFANPSADDSGFSQGQTVLGFVNVTTDGNGNASFDITLPIPAGAGSFISATATSPAGDTSEFAKAAQTTAALTADLSLTGMATPSPATLGQNLTYTLTVKNNGPTAATGVTLSDLLTTSLSFVSASSSQGSANRDGGTITAQLGALAVGASATVSIVVIPNAAGPVSNTASVGGNESDPTPSNNSATVNTTVEIANPLIVTTTADSGAGSLRAAIDYANKTPGTDTISFNVAGAGVHTITPLSSLPTITDPVIIDGFTQPGASPYDPVTGADPLFQIELSGTSAGGDANGLTIAAGNTTVRGLVIDRFVSASSTGGNAIALLTNGNDRIEGNFVGTDPGGTKAMGNSFGVAIESGSGNTIGGSTAAARNIISGNFTDGVVVANFSANSTVIRGNSIGTGWHGNEALGNGGWGVELQGSSVVVARNLITNNGNDGILAGDFETIMGNRIVTNSAAGVREFGNGTTIGGPAGDGGNVISGNAGDGIAVQNPIATFGNVVQNNLIGTDLGTVYFPFGNGGDGVSISTSGEFGGGSYNTIGDSVTTPSSTSDGNVIAFNDRNGVSISSENGSAPSNDSVAGNSIFSNTLLGIDLGNDGETPNGSHGQQPGPNHWQEFPVITSAAVVSNSDGQVVQLVASLKSSPSSSFRVDFLEDVAGDTSESREHVNLLGSTSAVSDADGNATFSGQFFAYGPGTFYATATDAAGNTSEVSVGVAGLATNPLVVTTNTDSGPGSLRAAIAFANSHPGPDTISFNIPGTGIQTITPLSALPAITDPATIDGYTQPGSNANSLANGDNAAILIEIDGTDAGDNVDGLVISAGASTIRGLSINGFSSGAGIRVTSLGGDTVTGDFLGVDTGGDGQTFAVPVAKANYVGVRVESANNTIGGVNLADRDIVSGNSFVEVYVLGTTASSNTVEGNYVGTSPSGTESLSNPGGGDGVDIDFGSASNTVGGTVAGSRNVISGNGYSGVRIAEAGTNANVVEGNFIGVDITGIHPLGNGFHGVLIHRGAMSNLIGGTSAGAGNVISANTLHGIAIADASTSGNLIEGNFIGTDVSGTADLGNGDEGVSIAYDAFNNTVGGTSSGAGNTIAYNSMNGVTVEIGTGSGNAILSNAIFGNHLLGIDLGNDGVTLNTAATAPHVGPNMLQSFPVLSSVSSSGQDLLISGTLDGIPPDPAAEATPTIYRVEFFANADADPSGYGQGKVFLGAEMVTLNPDGIGAFVATLPAGTLPNPFVTATATDPNGNSSEFSNEVRLPMTSDVSLLGKVSTAATIVGSLATYSFTGTNVGPGPATGLTLTDLLPSGVSFVSATTSQGTVSHRNGTVTANLGTLASGANITVTITVMLTTAGTSVDTASVGSISTDPNLANNSASLTIAATLRMTTDLTATVEGTAIMLQWSPAPGAESYNVYRATSSGAEALYQRTVSAAITGGVVTYTDDEPKAGVTYDYEITAVAGAIESARSNEASASVHSAPSQTPPAAPIHVHASLLDTGGSTFAPIITWGYADPTGVTRFLVYRSSGSGGEVELTDPSGVSAHNLIDRSAQPGSTYTYRVIAVSGGVEGPHDALASVTVPAAKAVHPTIRARRAARQHNLRGLAFPRGPMHLSKRLRLPTDTHDARL